jgi:dihydroflavonol-4-reductase
MSVPDASGGRACVVTGAGGFIGYQLANALACDGHRVVGVDRHFPEATGVMGPPRFSPVVADFRDAAAMRAALRGTSVLFHLAAAHLAVRLPESDYWDINVHSLPALLRLAQEAGVSRVVHTSSVGVYGDVGTTPATEQTPPRPQSVYGATKLAGEAAVLGYGRAQGLDVVVLRPAWVYGPGCPRTAKLYDALRRRRFVLIGGGDNLRHPLYIEDMLQAFRRAAGGPGAGAVFLVAGERAVTTRALVEAFCRTFELPPPVLRLPLPLGVAAGAGCESICALIGREPPFSRRSLEFFTTNNVFDTSRARAVLGFEPRYSLGAGLRATRARVEAHRLETRVCVA